MTEGAFVRIAKRGGELGDRNTPSAECPLRQTHTPFGQIAERTNARRCLEMEGEVWTPFGRTVDGFETQFGTNHLGHFAFVNRIAPLIAPGGRLVIVASSGHRVSDVDLDDPNFEHQSYDQRIAYGRSKTANVLFAVEFDRRHRAHGVRAAALHPGVAQTALDRHMDSGEMDKVVEQINAMSAAEGGPPLQYKTHRQGAATSVWTAFVARAEEIGGRYCEDCRVSQVTHHPISPMRPGVMAYAVDPERGEALWAKSEEMIGERFPADV